ncbi:MAG: permease [bacterium]|nr:permease [bacterium]
MTMDHDHHQTAPNPNSHGASCHAGSKSKSEWLLWSMSLILVVSYAAYFFLPETLITVPYGTVFAESVVELLHKMWWGVLIGIVFVGILAGVPRELVMSILGKGGTLNGIVRATAAGVLLDLCSHGILLIGMQLYKRGASLGQMMAFLIASPWNSLSLTLILWALVGLQWTLCILALSLLLAIVSGVIFDKLVDKGVLPPNPNSNGAEDHRGFRQELTTYMRLLHWTPSAFVKMLYTGLIESRMILRWIFFGIVLASIIRVAMPVELFAQVFGPTLAGLGATLLFATILEVCSEGSMPVAADFLLRAKAPGNMFGFLMTGVSTDYTEMLMLKETTGRWKIAFFLPLVILPQVVLIALILNQMTL